MTNNEKPELPPDLLNELLKTFSEFVKKHDIGNDRIAGAVSLFYFHMMASIHDQAFEQKILDISKPFPRNIRPVL